MDELSAFDYVLPPDRIAQEPLAERDASRLLYLHRDSGEIAHRVFRDVVDILQPGDLLVMNDTRVTALRLYGAKTTGGQVELLLLERLGYGRFETLAKPGKRLQPGATVGFENDLTGVIEADRGDGRKLVRFDGDDVDTRLAEIGLAPLPPYVHKPLRDRERYQTVYATHGGSAAAPTAGLHFTSALLAALDAKGVRRATVTLDVGLDTFRPIAVDDPAEHAMHGERCVVPPEMAEAVAICKGRIVAVGTTSARTLESFATGPRRIEAGEKVSKLFIQPGYRFQVIDGMFTNFHMPRTTMLLMISALAGSSAIANAYQSALEENYRFLSLGDSMLIL